MLFFVSPVRIFSVFAIRVTLIWCRGKGAWRGAGFAGFRYYGYDEPATTVTKVRKNENKINSYAGKRVGFA